MATEHWGDDGGIVVGSPYIEIETDGGSLKLNCASLSCRWGINQLPSFSVTIPFADSILSADGGSDDFDNYDSCLEIIAAVQKARSESKLLHCSIYEESTDGGAQAVLSDGRVTAASVIMASTARSSHLVQISATIAAADLNFSLMRDTVVVTADALKLAPNPMQADKLIQSVVNKKFSKTLFNASDDFDPEKLCMAIEMKGGISDSTPLLERLSVFMSSAIHLVTGGEGMTQDEIEKTVQDGSTFFDEYIDCDLSFGSQLRSALGGGKANLSLNFDTVLFSNFLQGLMGGNSVLSTLISTITSPDYKLCLRPAPPSESGGVSKLQIVVDNAVSPDATWENISDSDYSDIISSYNIADSLNIPDTFIVSFSNTSTYMLGDDKGSRPDAGSCMGIYTKSSQLKSYVSSRGGQCPLEEGSQYRVKVVKAPTWLEMAFAASLANDTFPKTEEVDEEEEEDEPQTAKQKLDKQTERLRDVQNKMKSAKSFMNQIAEALYTAYYGANDSVTVTAVARGAMYAAEVMVVGNGLEVETSDESPMAGATVYGRLASVSYSYNGGTKSSASASYELDKVVFITDGSTEATLNSLFSVGMPLFEGE